MDKFDNLIAEARKQTKKTGLKQADIDTIISAVRYKK
tara:strand:+ start:190 stop:300 length:111 start_codon:yes stop_codon:yes gene_type:complete